MDKTAQSAARPVPCAIHAETSPARNRNVPARRSVELNRPQYPYGNQRILRQIGAGSLQRKLAVNQLGDVYEQEADRVADAVMRMPALGRSVGEVSSASPLGVQRCACGNATGEGGQCEDCKANTVNLHRVASGAAHSEAVPPIVHEVLRAPGRPLDVATRAFMEPRFGADFGGVRVHTDSHAAESAKAVNALAYTVGSDIVFADGKYPSNPARSHLLAHELTHVLHQGENGLGSAGVLQRALGPCPDTATPHRLLKKDAVDPGVREVQRKLNLFDAHEKATPSPGHPGVKNAPLDEDCIFGNLTFGAVVDFQKQVFPGNPAEHDGRVGDHTWAELDKISGTPTPLPAAPVASPSDPAARIANVNLTMGVPPRMQANLSPAGNQIVVSLNGDVTALGSADLVGSADCDKFTFGFIQMCRPFDVFRATYHSPSAAADFVVDPSATIRAGRPTLDVGTVGNIFARSEDATAKSKRCAGTKPNKHAYQLFFDSPSRSFPVNPSVPADSFVTGLAWQSFFFTAFSVQVPDGTMRHLQSFFWDIIFCATFGPPSAGNVVGNLIAQTTRVPVGNPANGANDSDFLRLAGAPSTNSCNNVITSALPPNPTATGPGTFTTACPVP